MYRFWNFRVFHFVEETLKHKNMGEKRNSIVIQTYMTSKQPVLHYGILCLMQACVVSYPAVTFIFQQCSLCSTLYYDMTLYNMYTNLACMCTCDPPPYTGIEPVLLVLTCLLICIYMYSTLYCHTTRALPKKRKAGRPILL